ncbi:exported hypothetical protein [Agrobacterium genomosp. 13 str. CFBP 6927]|uniref:Transposase n=1 Tax=Agrobacterium genomosp. 13 str. CFBP 6927 TaxID=1183428 RepID=A0ABM9VFJ2_9HYPH|nr:exported hypothetical protein [Agrobacterium genomosp. 13 str. CFBP 6927]
MTTKVKSKLKLLLTLSLVRQMQALNRPQRIPKIVRDRMRSCRTGKTQSLDFNVATNDGQPS